MIERRHIQVTTLADGTKTVYTDSVNGRLMSIAYVKTSFDDGVEFVIKTESTQTPLWSEAAVNASVVKYPRAQMHTTAGAAINIIAGGEPQVCEIPIWNERISIAVSSGGNVKVGDFYIYVDY